MHVSTRYDTVQFNTRSNCAVGIRIRILIEILVMNHLTALFSAGFSKRRQASTLSARNGAIDCAYFPILFATPYSLRLATELSIAMGCFWCFYYVCRVFSQ